MQISEDLRKRLTISPAGVLCLRVTRGDCGISHYLALVMNRIHIILSSLDYISTCPTLSRIQVTVFNSLLHNTSPTKMYTLQSYTTFPLKTSADFRIRMVDPIV